MAHRYRIAAIVLGATAIVFAPPARAVDGVIEINQSRATAGGITPGDNPGYPIDINSQGSYRLTGDLQCAAGATCIAVGADNVTIDLNGFNVVSNGGVLIDGIGVGNRQNVTIKNGTVRGFTRHGILAVAGSGTVSLIGVRLIGNAFSGAELQGSGNLVDGCTAVSNGMGIRASVGSLVINTIARNNTGVGIHMDTNGGYRSNVLTGNNGGDANAQVGGGTGAMQLGTNVCGSDTVCP